MPEDQFINIAFYQFAEIAAPHEHKTFLREEGFRLALKGTILLSLEGVNGMLSGTRDTIDEFKRIFEARLGLVNVTYKKSYSNHQPYTRMLVKVKREIISMGMPEVKPAEDTGVRLEARDFKKWMDEKRPMILLDTRNVYEIEDGTFEGAEELGLDSFRAFPKKLDEWAEKNPSAKERPVVMFCTGGIRCEKATAYAKLKGFKDVYQLEGGILKYFEEIGGDYYKGDCYIFDKREALRPDLAEK